MSNVTFLEITPDITLRILDNQNQECILGLHTPDVLSRYANRPGFLAQYVVLCEGVVFGDQTHNDVKDARKYVHTARKSVHRNFDVTFCLLINVARYIAQNNKL